METPLYSEKIFKIVERHSKFRFARLLKECIL